MELPTRGEGDWSISVAGINELSASDRVVSQSNSRDGRRDRVRRLLAPYAMLAPALAFMVFVAIAAGFLVSYSLNSWSPEEGMVSGWTLSSYVLFFTKPYFFRA